MKRISELTIIQPNAPGSITYQNNELKAVLRNKDVSTYGNVYVGRGDLIGCEVVVLVLRKPREPLHPAPNAGAKPFYTPKD